MLLAAGLTGSGQEVQMDGVAWLAVSEPRRPDISHHVPSRGSIDLLSFQHESHRDGHKKGPYCWSVRIAFVLKKASNWDDARLFDGAFPRISDQLGSTAWRGWRGGTGRRGATGGRSGAAQPRVQGLNAKPR